MGPTDIPGIELDLEGITDTLPDRLTPALPDGVTTYSSLGALPVAGFRIAETTPAAIADANMMAMTAGSGALTLQAGGFGNALCEAGLGALLSVLLYLLTVVLFVLAMVDIAKGFMEGKSSKGGRQASSGSSFRDGGMKLVGVIVVAALPSLLAGAGFSVISCVETVNVFG